MTTITTISITTQKYGLNLGSGAEYSYTCIWLLMGVGTGESTMTIQAVLLKKV